MYVENESYPRREDENGGQIKAEFFAIGNGATRNDDTENNETINTCSGTSSRMAT
jgi:hypothetical protein